MRIPFLSTGKRKWDCLAPAKLASYVDGTLPGSERIKAENHLSGCRACRDSLGVLVKSQTADPAGVPASAIARVRHLGSSQTSRSTARWAWAAAGAIACALAGWGIFSAVQHPNAEVATISPASASPTATHDSIANNTGDDQVRKVEKGRPTSPAVVKPAPDSAVTRELEVQWQTLPGTVAYDVRIVTGAGDLVWSARTYADH